MKQLLITIAALVLVGCGKQDKVDNNFNRFDNLNLTEADENLINFISTNNIQAPPLVSDIDKSLLEAVEKNNIQKVRMLLNKGANINTELGSVTPLLAASSLEMVKLLVANGANIDAVEINGFTALNRAVVRMNVDIVKYLISIGADTSIKDLASETLLHHAAKGFPDKNGRRKRVSRNVNWIGSKEIVNILLANEADIYAENKVGFIPLNLAAQHGLNEIVELLIAKGTDVNYRIKSGPFKGRTPLYFVDEEVYKETADLLRKHGGKTGEELKAEGK
tara:strand:- start:972 stop:1805 length:834 start_codon:yes stop_codon:yes gene_type:complete